MESIEECQKFLLYAMTNDIYSFAEIRNAYDIKAEIMFVYQGEFEHGATIGGEFASLETLGYSKAMSDIFLSVPVSSSIEYLSRS